MCISSPSCNVLDVMTLEKYRNAADYSETLIALARSRAHVDKLKADLDLVRHARPGDVDTVNCLGGAGTGILFDGVRWVRSWESALRRAVEIEVMGLRPMHLPPGPVCWSLSLKSSTMRHSNQMNL